MKDYIKKYFKIWWIPIVSFLIPFSIFITGSLFESDFIVDISLWVFIINIVGTVISGIVQIWIKKWYLMIPQILITAFLLFFVSFIFVFSPPDYYGANKEMPTDIEISEPLEREPTKEDFENSDLIISALFQPGIYSFYTDYKPKEPGYFYIKAFEVTSNERLSQERMDENSRITVTDLTKEFYEGEFTIYEGSWGDKYAGRIELWFKPSNKEEEYKVAEKNYIVEGWMR